VRQGHLAFDSGLRNAVARFAAAGLVLAATLWLLQAPVDRLFAGLTAWRDESTLGTLVVIGGVIYAAMTVALFGKRWLAAMRRRKRPLAAPPLQPD
jgi:putative peptidoglycan lipid II flippase